MTNEEKFLEIVREFRNSGMGYGRMSQIINYEWSESQPSRAAMEFAIDRNTEPPVKEMFEAKKQDPLSKHWRNFDSGTWEP